MTGGPIKLALCVPSMGSWKSSFGLCFAQMCVYMATVPFDGHAERTAIVLDKQTSLLSRSRQECLEDALHQQCTHALFIDSDQTFPGELAHRLIAWHKPVVACNIAIKSIPSFPTARVRGASPFGIGITSEQPKIGLEKIWRVGMGVMMIDLTVMRGIPKPWFCVRYDSQTQQYVGEDWSFCEALEKAGVDMFVDHETSRMIGHMGDYLYSHSDIPRLELEKAAA